MTFLVSVLLERKRHCIPKILNERKKKHSHNPTAPKIKLFEVLAHIEEEFFQSLLLLYCRYDLITHFLLLSVMSKPVFPHVASLHHLKFSDYAIFHQVDGF